MANCSVKFHLGLRMCEFSSDRQPPIEETLPEEILMDQARLLINEYCKAHSLNNYTRATNVCLFDEKKAVASWAYLVLK
jgi:hypothetical protein